MSRRFKFLLVSLMACALALALTSSTAWAANAHFKNKPAVTFEDQGLSLSSSGAITGLGNGDVVITLTATGQPVSNCTNPAGATQPPGQNPAEITLTGVEQIPAGDIKNGNLSFTVGTSGPVTPVPGAPDCPNAQWTENITDVMFTSATITVYQPCTDTTVPISCTSVLTRTFQL